MTIDAEAWLNIEKVARKDHILPSKENHEEPSRKGIGIQIEDALVAIRNAMIGKYFNRDGLLVTVTCADVICNIFRTALQVLQETDVKVYVFCVDKIEMVFKAKTATAKKRLKQRQSSEARGEPKFLELPAGQTEYFEPDKPFPPSMSLIFKTPEAKRQFYALMVDYVTSVEFQSLIPKEKLFIFSGGYYTNDRLQPLFSQPRPPGQIPPLAISSDMIVAMEDEEFPELVEGDLDAWRWVLVFKELDFFVLSGDGDLFAVGMLNMHRILKDNPKRRGWFVTPRRAGTEPISSTVAAFKAKQQEVRESAIQSGCSAEEVYMKTGGASSSTSSTKPKWLHRYVNMPGFYKDIRKESVRLHVHKGISIANPVELFILALLLSSKSNDFICCEEFTRGIGGPAVYKTYLKHIDKLGRLIRVGAPAGDDPNHNKPGFRYIIINVKTLRTFAQLCYEEGATKLVRKQFRTEEERLVACKERADALFKKNYEDPRKIYSLAGNIAWTFQYLTHGIDKNIPMTDPLLKTPDGLSIYGFDEEGWTLNVNMTNNIICPPLLHK